MKNLKRTLLALTAAGTFGLMTLNGCVMPPPHHHDRQAQSHGPQGYEHSQRPAPERRAP